MSKSLNFLLFCLIICSSVQRAPADGPPIQWQKTFGGSELDEGYSVQQTSDGGYIIAGKSQSYGVGYFDVYLIKTDPNGNQEWQKTFGGSSYDEGWSVQQTSDGGFIIAGVTGSFGAGGSDVYLIKTDPNGNQEWEKTFGGSNRDEGYSVQQTSDGGYIIAGITSSFGAGNWDVYLIKTDPNGDSLWQKTFGGSDYDYGISVRQTSDGGFIIAGWTESFGAGSNDVYLIKTDPNGESQWQKTFGGSYWEEGFSVHQTSDGGYIIAGTAFGVGADNIYLIKTDSEGNSLWQKTFGGSSSEGTWLVQVQQTSDGGYIIASDTYSFGAGYFDVYLIKTDSAGNSLWQKTFGGSGVDRGYSVKQTSDGGYIISGTTCSYGAGSYDVYLIKLCSENILLGDLNCDGSINFEDLRILAEQWLQPPSIPSADIAPSPNDGIANFLDFAVLAEDWLEGTIH